MDRRILQKESYRGRGKLWTPFLSFSHPLPLPVFIVLKMLSRNLG
jgi:hypothetical protein